MSFPNLLTLADHGGDWEAYIDAVYESYIRDVVRQKPTFKGKPVSFKHVPATDGKGAAFWHAISEANGSEREEDRIPDLRRCERISWPAYMLANVQEDGSVGPVKWWETKRNGRTRVVLWLEEEEYAMVLEERGEYYLFWTTYSCKPGRQAKFATENAAFWRKPGA